MPAVHGELPQQPQERLQPPRDLPLQPLPVLGRVPAPLLPGVPGLPLTLQQAQVSDGRWEGMGITNIPCLCLGRAQL